MMELTAQELERLDRKGIHPVSRQGEECLVEIHGRTIRCAWRDIRRIAAPSLKERLCAQLPLPGRGVSARERQSV
ncbi:hypothetical protein [Kushneria phosphatilytica]|uniref:Uncharacterized protein n=1 Tax=Kushneria phosphatilytica TaxID=657387 RepID=A0A1S1NT31_9GAMM|nr:hypothetical protein [Kushneria phosphatilytica]OHV08745.1 hypothetical protein BH688_12040 [Kushneria phosphatilytica]QEL12466.1 hypothetical protein FY550_15845 [Kushneria phosphatilytica]